MQVRSEETRRRILDTASEAFARQGYEATAVAEICQAAGVSKGAFYHHFPSKHDVFLELLNRWLGGLEGNLSEIWGGAGNTPQRFIHMTAEMQHIFTAAGGQLPMFMEFLIQASRDPEVWKATVAPYHHFVEFFARQVDAGMQEGTLKEIQPELAGRVIIALALGILVQGLLDPRAADWPEVARQGMNFLMNGLAKEEAV